MNTGVYVYVSLNLVTRIGPVDIGARVCASYPNPRKRYAGHNYDCKYIDTSHFFCEYVRRNLT